MVATSSEQTRPDGTVQGQTRFIVAGLKPWLKVYIFCLQLPRAALFGFLWWLGCRWLTATLSWSDLLLNGLALEFILNIDELLYKVMVPKTGQKEVQNLFVPHLFGKKDTRDCRNMFGIFALGIVSVTMAYVYIIFQQVLPEYNWDVRDRCVLYLQRALDY